MWKDEVGTQSVNCKGLMGKIFGHCYHDVFDEFTGAAKGDVKEYGGMDADILEKYREKKSTYIHSICRRCGDIKSRKSEK